MSWKYLGKHDETYLFRVKALDTGATSIPLCPCRRPKLQQLTNYLINFCSTVCFLIGESQLLLMKEALQKSTATHFKHVSVLQLIPKILTTNLICYTKLTCGLVRKYLMATVTVTCENVRNNPLIQLWTLPYTISR